MLSKLWDRNDVNYKHLTYGKVNSLKHYFNSYVDGSNTYYGSLNNVVMRPNPIIKLLDLLEVNTHETITELYYRLDATAIYIANDVNLVTTVNKNTEPLTGTIIKDMDEYFLYTTDKFDINNRSLTTVPIKCIYTTLDRIFITHPTMFTEAIEDIDFTIYEIDVVKLGIGYYHWMKEQHFLNNNTDAGRFLFEVVFNNLTSSLVDMNLANRFIRMFNGETPSKFKNFNVFILKDFTRDLEKCYDFYIKNLKIDRLDYPEYLSNIPLMVKDNLLDILDIPSTTLNRRNKWLVWLSRFDFIIFIIKELDSTTNRHRLNDLRINLEFDKRNGIFKVKNSGLQFLIDDKVQEIENILKDL